MTSLRALPPAGVGHVNAGLANPQLRTQRLAAQAQFGDGARSCHDVHLSPKEAFQQPITSATTEHRREHHHRALIDNDVTPR